MARPACGVRPAMERATTATAAFPAPVRVRLHTSGINPSDWKARRGGAGRAMIAPLIIPHSDGAGVIDHLKTHLVAWAWEPGIAVGGVARTVPPLGYAAFLQAAQTWVAGGQPCPNPHS